MPRHANLPFHLYVHIDNRALGPTMPAGTTRAIWHAVYCRPGQIVMAHVLLETGAEWCGVPLHMIAADPDAFRVKPLADPDAPGDLQPWGAMGEHVEAVHLEYLEGMMAMGSGKDQASAAPTRGSSSTGRTASRATRRNTSRSTSSSAATGSTCCIPTTTSVC